MAPDNPHLQSRSGPYGDVGELAFGPGAAGDSLDATAAAALVSVATRVFAVATTAYIDTYAELSVPGAAVDGEPDEATGFSDSTAPVVHPVSEELTTRALTYTDHPTTGRLTTETSGPEVQAFDFDLSGKRELSGGAAVYDLLTRGHHVSSRRAAPRRRFVRPHGDRANWGSGSSDCQNKTTDTFATLDRR